MQKQKIHIKRRARGEPKGTGKKIEKCYVIKSESHKATWTFISLNFQVKELKLQLHYNYNWNPYNYWGRDWNIKVLSI